MLTTLRRGIWLSVGLGRLDKGLANVRSRVLTREALARVRLKAIRRGVWFRELKDIERKLVELTVKVVERVRSPLLAKLVSSIVRKLLDAMEGEVSRLLRTKGRSLAQKLSQIAQGWGNKSAVRWPEDAGFIQFLTIINLPALRFK